MAGSSERPSTGERRPVNASVGASQTVLIAHPSPDLYGSDRVMLETVSGLVEAGHRVVVALPSVGPLVAALLERGAEPVTCPSPVLRKSSLSPVGLVRLAGEAVRGLIASFRLLRRVRPAVILINTVTIPLWAVVGRLARVPVACHVHEAEQSTSIAVRRVLYAPLLLTSGLITNSQFCLAAVTEAWSSLERRAEVVYNGVASPTNVPGVRPSLDVVQLLFVGRLSPRKGPQVALAALERLNDRGVPAHLSLLGAVFPGYEWFETELREQVIAGDLSAQVTFCGFDSNVWGYLAQADIVVVPSIMDESFGNTAVEAMLAERPLVVSAMSGLREAAAGYATARQVEPDDADAIADAVAELSSSWSSIVTEVRADRELALSRHSPEIYRRQIVELVGSLVEQPRPGR